MRPTLYDGDTFDHKGHTFRVRFERDEWMSEPWKVSDGHGIVSEWTHRAKRPGERVLIEEERSYNPARRYYDVAETLKIARRDGWGVAGGKLPGETDRAYTARAVEEDYKFLRAWCRDDWQYVSVSVTHLVEDEDEDGEYREDRETASLGGVETWKDYHCEVAIELADELMAQIEVENPDVVLSEN